MKILNIAGYKFTSLIDLEPLRSRLHAQCEQLQLKGTILLSHEGINVNLAGSISHVHDFIAFIKNDLNFADIAFHETYSKQQPFKRLKIKIKKEIITLKQPAIIPTKESAPHISPEELKTWLDEKRDITLLDTRNEYEVQFGSFAGAVSLPISDFSEFPLSLNHIQHGKPIVMFCTGGIRCEKAALYLMNEGYSDVYQLQGGILGYFAKVGGAHYVGDCFVFDERVAIDPQMQCSETIQCKVCQRPVTKADQLLPTYSSGVSCPACLKE